MNRDSSSQTIIDIIKQNAILNPHKLAYTFVLDGEEKEENITFLELFESSKSIAGGLLKFSSPGDRIILLLPSGIEFIKAFYGCLFAGIIAVPAPLTNISRTFSKLEIIADNSKAQIIITGFETKKIKLIKQFEEKCQIITLDSLEAKTSCSELPKIKPSDIAFLQYTSGTTNIPKGVIVKHSNITENEYLIKHAFNVSNSDIIFGWLPHYHDMGLIGLIMQSVYSQCHCILMSPYHFFEKPSRWFNLISKYAVTISGGPNFSYNLCFDKISDSELEGINLKSWKIAFNGAELVRENTLERFSKRFSKYGFNPNSFKTCYGMAETTLLVSASPVESPITIIDPQIHNINFDEYENLSFSKEKKLIVGCGIPIGYSVKILNKDGEILPEKNVGEINVSGKSVTDGYWNNLKETEDSFSKQGAEENRFLRTGDLGFLLNQELFVVGRIKDLIKVNGRNIYAHFIEYCICDIIPTINDSLVFSIEKNEREEIVILCEIEAKDNIVYDEIQSKIRQLLFVEFEIEIYDIKFLRKGLLPKTSSGKKQRNKGKQMYFDNKNIFLESKTIKINISKPIDEKLKILQDTFNEVIDQNKIGVGDNFFQHGLNSITITKLIFEIKTKFNIDVPIDYFFEFPTIEKFSEQLNKLKKQKSEIVEAHLKEPNSLSLVQQGIWFDQQVRPDSNAFNIPVIFDLPESLNISLFKEVFIEIVNNNEILRASFQCDNSNIPRQYFNKLVFDIPVVETQEEFIEEHIIETVKETFSLNIPPLFRAKLLKIKSSYKFLFVAHHIIIDGTSIQLLLKELIKKYQALNEKFEYNSILGKNQYSAYVNWELNYIKSFDFKISGKYWENLFHNKELDFCLPYDKITSKYTPSGANVSKTISGLTTDFEKFLLDNNCTFNTYILSCFILLLKSVSQQDQIIVYTPINGRVKKEFSNMLGVFINAIPIYIDFKTVNNLSNLINQVNNQVINGLKHQNYPLQKIKENTKAFLLNKKILSKVFFNTLNFVDEGSINETFNIFRNIKGIDINMDVDCYCIYTNNEILLRFSYNKNLFLESTITKYLIALEDLIRKVCTNQFSIDEVLQVQTELLKTSTLPDYKLFFGNKFELKEETIIDLLIEQFKKTPDNIALKFGDQSITYSDVHLKSNCLASIIREKGICKNEVVPIIIERSIELPLAIIAVMKCGAAYVPFEHDWPEERIDKLINDINPKIILTSKNKKIVIKNKSESVVVNSDQLHLEKTELKTPIQPDDPIYGFFTSGTTGLPKCTINTHRGLVNRLLYMNRRFSFNVNDRTLVSSRPTFDVSFWQIFWPLINGGTAVFPDYGDNLDFERMLDLIEKEKITISDFVPSIFKIIVEYLINNPESQGKFNSFRQILIGGEAMDSGDVKTFKKLFPSIGITNTYGPTEASIGTVFYEIEKNIPAKIPLGRPIDNVLTIISNEDQIARYNEEGEILLGGICLGNGYLNNPEKTHSSFIQNKFNNIPSQFLYKTGDIGFYTEDGNFQFIGRLDDQVKINGIRIELDEIRSHITSMNEIKDAIVVIKQNNNNQNFLVVYYTSFNNDEINNIRSYLKNKLPEAIIPNYYVKLEKMPLLTNGKIDKKALKNLIVQNKQRESPINRTEKKLVSIWSIVLKVDKKSIYRNSNFFELGGNSLHVASFITQVQEQLNVKLSFSEVFQFPELSELGDLIIKREPKKIANIKPIEKKKYYDLSSAQRRLYFLNLLNPDCTNYNIPGIINIQGKLDIGRLKSSILKLIEIHESFRTYIKTVDDVPKQFIIDRKESSNFKLIQSKIDSVQEINFRIAQFIKPFDLQSAPLFRAILLEYQNNNYFLLFDMHHIISDGVSHSIIIRDILNIYIGNPISSSNIQYKDYALWQNNFEKSDRLLNQEKFWLDQFKHKMPRLDNLFDFKGKVEMSYSGNNFYYSLNPDTCLKLQQLIKTENSTLFIFLLSTFYVLLHKYTGENDIIVGSPVIGRNTKDLDNIIGMFVGQLPLRQKINENEKFSELISRTKNTVIGAFDNQDYQFDALVTKLNLSRELGRNPLFDIVFAIDDEYVENIKFQSLKNNLDFTFKSYDFEVNTSKTALRLGVLQKNDHIRLKFTYQTSLFIESTIKKMAKNFEMIIDQIIKNSEVDITNISLSRDMKSNKIINEMKNLTFDF